MKTLIVLSALLCGCGVLQKPEPIEIRAQPAEILMLPKVRVDRPLLEIHKVSPEAEPDVVVKSYVATVYQLIRYSESLEELVEQLQSLHVETYER